MFIQLQPYTADRYTPTRTIRSDEAPTDGGTYIPLEQIENALTTLPSGSRYIDLLPIYKVIQPGCIVKISEGVYRIDFNVEIIKARKVSHLKSLTRHFITSDSPNEERMPVWKQSQFMEYLTLYKQKKDKVKLDVSGQGFIDSMVNPGETEDGVAQGIADALTWIQDCRQAYKGVKAQINAETDIERLLKFDVSCPYPEWIGA